MRIAELSRRTGVPVPTIKYYLREGLIHPGERTSPNQAQYDDSHVRRLTLIRALLDVGGLSIAAAHGVLAKTAESGRTVFEMLGKAQYAMSPHREPAANDDLTEASREVDALITRHGWNVGPNNPGRGSLAQVLVTVRRLGHPELVDALDDYAAAANDLAEVDVARLDRGADADSIMESVVVLTTLGDAMLVALRRLAQENAAARTFRPNGDVPDGPPPGR